MGMTSALSPAKFMAYLHHRGPTFSYGLATKSTQDEHYISINDWRKCPENMQLFLYSE